MNFNPFNKPTPIPIEAKQPILPTPIPIEPRQEQTSTSRNIKASFQVVEIPIEIKQENTKEQTSTQKTDNNFVAWSTPIPIEPKSSYGIEKYDPSKASSTRSNISLKDISEVMKGSQGKFENWHKKKTHKKIKNRRFGKNYSSETCDARQRAEINVYDDEVTLEVHLDFTFESEAQAIKALTQVSEILRSQIEAHNFGVARSDEIMVPTNAPGQVPAIIERKSLDNVAKPRVVEFKDKETGYSAIVTELDSRLMSDKARKEWGIKDDVDLDPQRETRSTLDDASKEIDEGWESFDRSDEPQSSPDFEVLN